MTAKAPNAARLISMGILLNPLQQQGPYPRPHGKNSENQGIPGARGARNCPLASVRVSFEGSRPTCVR